MRNQPSPRKQSAIPVMFAFFLGALFWHFFTYWWQLLHQPTLTARPKALIEQGSIHGQARQIAEANLRLGIEERHLPSGDRKKILWAGWRNFREPWARDFGFASFGLMELNEKQVIKETLELYLHFQQENGRFPVKIHSTSVLDRYLHSLFARQQPTRRPLRPKYHTAHRTISLDGNCLLVIAALNYLRHYEDNQFAQKHWSQLKQALHWVETQALQPDGLLHQGAYTDWADSIKRTGAVHYPNVLYWKALREFSLSAAKYGYAEDANTFQHKEQALAQAIQQHFWDNEQGFFITSQQFPHILSSDGNTLAIAWKLATPVQALRILDNMARFGMSTPVPTRCTNHEYGPNYVAWENKLGGIPHYHTAAAWLWLGSWHLIALVQAGEMGQAAAHLQRMEAVIVRDKVVHEVYDVDGRFLKTRWYESEAPLTWSAAMFIYAQSVWQRTADSEQANPVPQIKHDFLANL
jgi:glycogen debranching enzyme